MKNKIIEGIISFFLGVAAFVIGRRSAKKTLNECKEVQKGWRETEEKCNQLVKESEERLQTATIKEENIKVLQKELHEEKLEFEHQKHLEKMKELEEKHNEKMKELEQLKRRNSERLENAKTLDEQLEAFEANSRDILNAFYNISDGNHKETRIVFRGKLAKMMEQNSDNDVFVEESLSED